MCLQIWQRDFLQGKLPVLGPSDPGSLEDVKNLQRLSGWRMAMLRFFVKARKTGVVQLDGIVLS